MMKERSTYIEIEREGVWDETWISLEGVAFFLVLVTWFGCLSFHSSQMLRQA